MHRAEASMGQVEDPVFAVLTVGMFKLHSFLQTLETQDSWNVNARKMIRDHLIPSPLSPAPTHYSDKETEAQRGY